MNKVYVLDAVRTPFGRYGGALAGIRPDDLAAHVGAGAACERAPGLDPADDRRRPASATPTAPARTTATSPGWRCCWPGCRPRCPAPPSTGCAAPGWRRRSRPPGDRRRATPTSVVAGGVESMSRAPWVLPKPERGFPRGHETLHSTTLGWRMVNPAMPAEWTISLGESTEHLAEMYASAARSRTSSPLRSHQRAGRAWDGGRYDAEVVPVPGAELERDEGIRADTRSRNWPQLKPAFRADGTVTAGNSSPAERRRGRAAARRRRAAPSGSAREPLARIVGRGVGGVDPRRVRDRPGRGGEPALRRAGHRLGRPRLRRAERGVRRAVAGLPGRAGPSWTRRRSTSAAARSRSATRSALPAPASSAARPRTAPPRRPLWGGGHLHRRRPGAGPGAAPRSATGHVRHGRAALSGMLTRACPLRAPRG